MTQYARVVIQDCKAARDELKAGATGHVFRSRWVAAVTLLRAVGHVLEKVDSKRDSAMAAAIREAHARLKSSKPEPRVFWEFIDAERNNVLKAYRFGAKESVTVRPGTGHIAMYGRRFSGLSGPTTYDQFLDGGPFAGKAPDAAVAAAIEWWESYLADIDADAARRARASA
jgi:hypothetical protein